VFERIIHVQILADGNGSSALLAEHRVTFDVLDKKRFLKPVGAAVGKRIAGFERTVDAVALIRVGHDDKIFAQFFAYRAYDANILIKIETDFDLHAVKPLIGKPARASSDLRRFFGIKRRGINWNFVATLPAKKLVERHAARFTQDIPQRHVDAAQGDDADATRGEFLMPAAHVNSVPDRIDLRRIHADEQRFNDLGDDH